MQFTRVLYNLLIKHVAMLVIIGVVMLNALQTNFLSRSLEQQAQAQKNYIEQTLNLYIPAEVVQPVTTNIIGWRFNPIDGSKPLRKRYGKSWSVAEKSYSLDSGQLIILYKTPISAFTNQFLLLNLFWICFCFGLLLTCHVMLYKPWIILKQLEAWAYRVEKNKKFKFYVADKSFTLVNTIRELNRKRLAAEKGGQKADHFIRSQTFLDETTGLGNRLYFEHRLDAVLQEEKVYGAVLIIQYGVLDSIREQEGKLASHEYLRQFAEILTAYMDDTAQTVVSRISSNDFAILLPYIDGSEVEKISLNILRMSQKVKLPSYIDTSTMCHIGADMYGVEDNSFQILAEADMALRAAQLHGPSGWFMYDSGELPASEIRGSVRWRTAIQNALDNSLFISFFQPVVDNTMRVHHNEVLVRMIDNKREFIGANVFLPMAKKCGMIPEIDKHVLEFIMLQFVQDRVAPVSVNIHIDSWLNRNFCNWLIQFLKRNSDYTPYLIFEISEFELARHAKKLKKIFAAIKRYNIQFMIDQVGLYVLDTGYLDFIDAEYLKVHQSIVNHIQERPENQMFIRSLQSVAAEKDLLIFATGVESESEMVILNRLGVMGIQGHYIKQPSQELVAATDVIDLDGDNLDL